MDSLVELYRAIIEGGFSSVVLGFFIFLFIIGVISAAKNPTSFKEAVEQFSRIANLMFYTERNLENSSLRKKVTELEEEVKHLSDFVNSVSFQESAKIIEQSTNSYLDDNIKSLINEKIEQKEAIESAIFESFEKNIVNNINKYLSELDEKKIKKLYKLSNGYHEKIAAYDALFETVALERKSSSFLKSFMINLFVMVNIGLFFIYYFNSGTINQYTAISLSGLYISLVGFIIYIFRASNARTSVLLAIEEDYKKQILAMEYVELISESHQLSENDVEFLRLLMVNHSERERKINHPYELILKGISGSNIQFKGGKMAMGTDGKAEK